MGDPFSQSWQHMDIWAHRARACAERHFVGPDVFHVEDSDVWENLSFCPRHVLVNNLQPADGPSVRAKVCSDLRAGSAEVTAEIASSQVHVLELQVMKTTPQHVSDFVWRPECTSHKEQNDGAADAEPSDGVVDAHWWWARRRASCSSTSLIHPPLPARARGADSCSGSVPSLPPFWRQV